MGQKGVAGVQVRTFGYSPVMLPTSTTSQPTNFCPQLMKVASKPTAQKDPLANPGNQVGQPGERESVLLALSTALAGIRERKELFGTIIEKIRPVIPVDDTGLLVLDKTGRYWQDWTNVDNYQGHAASTQLKQMGYDGLLPVDRWMEYTLNHTGIMTVGKFKEQYPEHPFGPVMWEAGLREMMFAPLVHRGDRLGVLFFDSQQAGTYSETHLPLFQAVADLIAVAVANILANEEILEREREKATLLSISEQLATIRDKHDLFSVIFQKLRPVFRFDDAVVVLCDEQRQHTLHLHTATNPSAQHNDHYQFIISERVPVAGTPYEEFLFNDAPKIYSYQYLSGRYPHHVGVRILKDFGLLESVFMPLRYGGRVLGTLEFHATEQGRFAESQMPLFSNVADQVAVAVANILADEEILEREREKSVLLSISEAVATIRDKQDLLKVVFEKVQPLFSFYDTGFFVLDPQGEYIEDWSVTFREVSPSAANLQLQASGAGKIRYAGSAIEWAIGRLKAAAGPQIFPYNDAIFSQYPDYPQFEVLKRIGYQESLAALLRTDGREMGLLFFNSLTADHFQASQFTLFQAVADQLAVAVANILANEEILQREREKALLLSLSEDMATIRDRNNLWRVMMEKVKTLVQFDDAVVGVYTNEGKTCNHLLTVSPPERMSNPHYQHIVNQDIPVDGPIAYLMSKPKYYAFPLHELLEQWPAHPGLLLMAQTGLRYTHHVKLNWAGKTLGFVHFHFDSTARPAQNQQNLLIAIADQVAVAVANILANEEILEREREKTHLLGISEAISRINNRKELLRVIYQHIQPVFPFDSAGLFITDVEKDILQEILDSEAFPDPLQHTLTEQNLLGPWKLSASNPDSWWMQEQPVIRSMAGEAALCEKYLGEAQFREGLAYGLQQFIGGPMYANGKKIGAICFNSVQEHFYTQAHEPLFRSISEQVAVAVANILANEEILEREREKALLLSLSEDMATIRDRDDLWRVMMEKIRPLVSFQDGGCFLINKTEHTYQPFLFNDFQGYFQQEPYRAYIGAHLPLEGSPAEWIKGQQSPFYYTQQQAAARFPHESGVQLATQVGLKSFVALQLHWNRQLIGLLILGYPGEDGNRNEALLKAIADQVAVAVANILANEEILQREQEKALLLSLSEDMATIRDRNDLWRVMMGKIKPLVGFDDAVVIVLSTDQQRLLHLLTMPTDERRANAHYQQVVSQWFVVKDSPFEWMINRQGNYQWDTQELAALYPDYPGIRLMQETNLRHTLHYKLNWGGNNIGFFHFHFTNQAQIDPVKLPLYKGIADQIAVAVANILANEEILEREREKSQLLEITELIAQVKATDDLLRLIVEKIKPLFGFHDCGLFVVSADGKTHSDLAAVLPDVSPSQWNETIAAVSANIPHRGSPIEWMMQELSAVSEPVLVDFKALAEKYPEYPQFAGTGLLEMGYRDCLTANLTVRGKPIGLFCINALQKDFFPRAVYPLFQSVTHNIAIAVANIRANEEILEREREKALLLDVSEAIATVRDKDALFAVLMEKIKPLVRFDNNATIFLFDKEKTYYSFWLHKLYQADSATPDFEAWTQKKTLVREDPLAQFLIAHRKAAIISIEEAVTKFPDQAAVQWARQIGLKQALHVPLQVGGDLIGFLSFDTLTDHAFSESQFPLVQSVADQVAVAVANILANEEILEREREKSRLLEISKAIAQISHRDDLLQVIIGHVKPLFHFDENALFVIDRDGKQYRMWYDNLLQPYEEGKRSQQGVGIPMKGNQVAEDVFRDRPAYLRDREEMLAFSAGNASLTEWIVASGIEEVMIGPLKVGGQIMGCFNSHSRRKGTFSSSMLPLYQNVCDQVAVAVANILANEEILERETEKATLLSLSEDMATIRDRDDLLNIILQKIKPIVGFNDAVISVYTPDFLSYKHFVTASPPERIAHPFYKEIVGVYLPLVGHPDEFVLGQIKAIEVLRWDTLDIQEAYPNNLIGCFLEENNLHYNLYMKLSWAGEIIGFMSFHFSQQASIQKTKYTLYKAIANQVAVAVANVLANEEILEREREKTQLLKVSEAISTIRDATSLFSSLSDIIRSIIAFDEAPMIFLLDEQRQHYRIFYSKVFDPSANLSSLEAWQQGKKPVATDPIATYLIGQNRTLVLNLKQAMEQWGDFPGKQTMLDLALAECLVAPLRVNDCLSGFLCVWSRREGKFETPKLNLFQSIADQVAVAVANILANEEILQREREKALQVAVIHALAQEGSWEEKFLRLIRVLQKYIPLDYLYLLLEKDKQYGRGHAYRRIGFDEYQSIDTEGFFRMTGINASKYLTMREQRVHTGPELLAGEAFEKAAGKYALLGLLARTFELESSIAIPLKLSHQGRYVLSVLSKKPHGLTPEHLLLLEKLSDPLALTLENLLAYEEIKGLKERLEVEKEYLEDEINVNYKFEDIIGASQSLKEVFKKVSQVATADSTVLVLGETGTGKELVARAIHNLSKRSDRALVKINCAALPAQLIESELFGHEKGAFTGALDRRIGKFELAHGSTIFLDEVGELPLELQAKLLRAIQEKEVERLGGNKVVKTDVRIIAATNRNLEKEVAQGRFRADLYFRLNVFPVTLPPLRDRKEDIPLLAVHFIRKMGKKLGKNITGVSNAAIKEMQAYNWPGNIRELEHIIERAADARMKLGRYLKPSMHFHPAVVQGLQQLFIGGSFFHQD